MPEYPYNCHNCEKSFSVERSMNDSSQAKCAHCGSTDLERIWSINFVGGTKSSASVKSTAASAGEMCASNPSKPKSCCPCG